MLQLIGLMLKAFITIAIGLMGFTWEPKQDVKAPKKEDKEREFILPVYLDTPLGTSMIIEASTKNQSANCTYTSDIAVVPVSPIPVAVALPEAPEIAI